MFKIIGVLVISITCVLFASAHLSYAEMTEKQFAKEQAAWKEAAAKREREEITYQAYQRIEKKYENAMNTYRKERSESWNAIKKKYTDPKEKNVDPGEVEKKYNSWSSALKPMSNFYERKSTLETKYLDEEIRKAHEIGDTGKESKLKTRKEKVLESSKTQKAVLKKAESLVVKDYNTTTQKAWTNAEPGDPNYFKIHEKYEETKGPARKAEDVNNEKLRKEYASQLEKKNAQLEKAAPGSKEEKTLKKEIKTLTDEQDNISEPNVKKRRLEKDIKDSNTVANAAHDAFNKETDPKVAKKHFENYQKQYKKQQEAHETLVKEQSTHKQEQKKWNTEHKKQKDLHDKYFKEKETLNTKIKEKNKQLNKLKGAKPPDPGKINALEKEIKGIRLQRDTAEENRIKAKQARNAASKKAIAAQSRAGALDTGIKNNKKGLDTAHTQYVENTAKNVSNHRKEWETPGGDPKKKYEAYSQAKNLNRQAQDESATRKINKAEEKAAAAKKIIDNEYKAGVNKEKERHEGEMKRLNEKEAGINSNYDKQEKKFTDAYDKDVKGIKSEYAEKMKGKSPEKKAELEKEMNAKLATAKKTKDDALTKEKKTKDDALAVVKKDKENEVQANTTNKQKLDKDHTDKLEKSPDIKEANETINKEKELQTEKIYKRDIEDAEDNVSQFQNLIKNAKTKEAVALLTKKLELANLNLSLAQQKKKIYEQTKKVEASRKACEESGSNNSAACIQYRADQNALSGLYDKLNKDKAEYFKKQQEIVSKEKFHLSSISLKTAVSPKVQKGGIVALVMRVIRFAVLSVGLLAILGVCVGGITLMISAGNETMVQNGKQTLFYSILGLVLVILSYVIVATVQSFVYGIAGSQTTVLYNFFTF